MTARGPIPHPAVINGSTRVLGTLAFGSNLASYGTRESVCNQHRFGSFGSSESRMLTSFSDEDLQEFSATRPSLNGEIMSSRIHHNSVIVGNLLLVFGGESEPLASNVPENSGTGFTSDGKARKLQSYYSVDLLTGRSRRLNTDTSYPPPLSGHCMVAWNRKIVIYGCVHNGNLMQSCLLVHNLNKDEIFELELHGPSPPPRQFPACVLLGSYMVIFGGQCADTGEFLSDLWILDLASQVSEWFQIPSGHLEGAGPLPRAHTCNVAYDNKMWILGGKGKDSVFCDIWNLDLSEKKWTMITSCQTQLARYGGVSGCLRDMWVIHGGYDAQDRHVREVSALSFADYTITTERIDVEIQPRRMLPSLVFHNAASGMLEDQEILVLSGGKTKKPKYINTVYIIKSKFPSLKETIQVTPVTDTSATLPRAGSRRRSQSCNAPVDHPSDIVGPLASTNDMKIWERQAPDKLVPAGEPLQSSSPAVQLRAKLPQNTTTSNPKGTSDELTSIFAAYHGTIAKTPSPSPPATSDVPLHTGEGRPTEAPEIAIPDSATTSSGLRQNLSSLRSQVKSLQETNEALEDEVFDLRKSVEESEHLAAIIRKIEENDYLRPIMRVLAANAQNLPSDCCFTCGTLSRKGVLVPCGHTVPCFDCHPAKINSQSCHHKI